jgi:hypothetical protein
VAGNAVTLEFAGDAKRLQQAARQASESVQQFGDSAARTGDRAAGSAAGTSRLESRLGSLGAATSGATDAIDTLGGGMQALADIQDFARAKAVRLERAQNDVEQAMADSRQAAIDLEQSQMDLNQTYADAQQATLDVGQAEIDRKQATLDAKAAQDDYNKAIKEHGKGSDEAKQAAIDLEQANQDLNQAYADAEQASLDAGQAEIDRTQATEDGKQATIDAKDAQLNLNDAMHEADPPELQEWADMIGLVTPLLSAVVGVLGLVTAAQWLWNSALFASPLTWIVLAIAAVIAIIVLIATKTTWFQDLWRVTWGGIKDAAAAVGSWFRDTLWNKWIKGAWDGIVNAGKNAWNWMKELPGKIKNTFARIADFLFAPFRTAFNRISDAWNNTVGRLSWTVPGWVPGVGGNSISAPRLPKFHTGGKIPGIPGQEVPFMGLAGETVLPAGRSGSDSVQVVVMLDSNVLIEGLARAVGRRGGNVQLVLGGRNAA